MGRPKPISIGPKHFKTQTEAKDFIKGLLNSQPLKKPIAEPHQSFLSALILLHPRAADENRGGNTAFHRGARGTRNALLLSNSR